MKNYNSLKHIQQDLYSNLISCQDLVEHYIKRASQKTTINAFVEIYKTEAIQAAKDIDIKIKNKTAGLLAGLVIGIKDNICYKDHIVCIFKNPTKLLNQLIPLRLLKDC